MFQGFQRFQEFGLVIAINIMDLEDISDSRVPSVLSFSQVPSVRNASIH